MKVQFLGTSAAEGCPAPFCGCDVCRTAREKGGKDVRTRSQALIDGSLLVDFPPDTYHHYLSTPDFDLPALRHVIITHSHSDHFYPLDIGLRCKEYAGGIQGTMTVYGNEAVCAQWEGVVQRDFSGCADLGDAVQFQQLRPYVEIQVGDHLVTPLPADHLKSECCYIYLIRRDGKTLLYANDTGIQLEPQVWQHLAHCRLDAVCMDCTAMNRRVGRYHMGLPDNAELRDRLISLGCAQESTRWIVTHFSHFGGLSHQELSAAAADHGFETAYDGFTVTF